MSLSIHIALWAATVMFGLMASTFFRGSESEEGHRALFYFFGAIFFALAVFTGRLA